MENILELVQTQTILINGGTYGTLSDFTEYVISDPEDEEIVLYVY